MWKEKQFEQFYNLNNKNLVLKMVWTTGLLTYIILYVNEMWMWRQLKTWKWLIVEIDAWPFNNQGESYPQNTNGTRIIIVKTSIPSNQEWKHFQIFDISRPKGTKLIFTTWVHKHCGTLKSYMCTITQSEQVCLCSGPTKHGCLGNCLKSAHIIVQVM